MKRKLLWISGILTITIMLVMNLYLIPAIEATTEGIRCFDMQSTGYSYDTAMQFLALLSEEGRSIYLTQQLPLDFIYPIAYTVFFLLLIEKLTGASAKEQKWIAVYLPAILLPVSDYAENLCSIRLLTTADPARSFVAVAGTITLIKSILMYAVFAIVLVLLIRKLKRH